MLLAALSKPISSENKFPLESASDIAFCQFRRRIGCGGKAITKHVGVVVQDGAERGGIEGPKCDSLGGPRFSSSIVNVEGRRVFGIAIENVDGVGVLGGVLSRGKRLGITNMAHTPARGNMWC